MSKPALYHEIDRDCKASEVKRIRMHDLCHFHVSLIIEMGFSVVATADHVGHESTDIAFRVSPEEAGLIDAQVAMSGLTKQDYVTKRLLARDVVVVPSSRVQRALRREAVRIYRELRRIRDAGDIGPELQARIDIFARTFEALGAEDPGRSDVEEEDAAIARMSRGGANEGGFD